MARRSCRVAIVTRCRSKCFKPSKPVKVNKIIVGFRPEAVAINPTGALTGNVLSVDLHGSYTMLIITLGSEENVIHARVSRDGDYRVGETLRFDLKPSMVRFFDAETERRLEIRD